LKLKFAVKYDKLATHQQVQLVFLQIAEENQIFFSKTQGIIPKTFLDFGKNSRI